MAKIKTRWRFAVEQLSCYPSAWLSIWVGTRASWPLILIATPTGLWNGGCRNFSFPDGQEMLAQTGITTSPQSLEKPAQRIFTGLESLALNGKLCSESHVSDADVGYRRLSELIDSISK